MTVLADIAKTSAPVAYGAGTLYSLHRPLQMVMQWQRHRLDIAERKQHLDQLRDEADGEMTRLALELFEQQGKGLMQERTTKPNTISVRMVTRAGAEIGEIQAVEMVTPDDPRATGKAEVQP